MFVNLNSKIMGEIGAVENLYTRRRKLFSLMKVFCP